MISLFTPAVNDQSLFYLGQLFGYVGNVLVPAQGASLLLATLFKVFNTVVLAVGALIVVYVTIVGVLKTAGEGAFLGKQWNSLWVPIRMVLGIAVLVPTPAGYSTIQIIMMWVIVQGIGAADLMWNTALNYINTTGSPYSTIALSSGQSSSSSGTGINGQMQNLFATLVCQQTAVQTYANPMGSGSGAYYCQANASADPAFCGAGGYYSSKSIPCTSNPSQCQITFGPGAAPDRSSGGECGTLQFCNAKACTTGPSSLACAACIAQTAVLKPIIEQLTTIANTFVQKDYEYRVFYEAPTPTAPPSWIANYCSDIGIANQCCLTSASLPLFPTNPGSRACQIRGSTEDFPPDNNPITGGTDFGNPSPDAVINIYWPFGIQPTLVGSALSSDFIQASVTQYFTAINGAVTTYLQGNQQSSGAQTQEAQNGWLMAGAYYYMLAEEGDAGQQSANPTFQMAGPNPALSPEGPLSTYRNNYSAASALVKNIASKNTPQGPFGSLPGLGGFGAEFNGLANAIIKLFQDMVSGGTTNAAGLLTNSLYELHATGEKILLTIEITFPILLLTITLSTILGYIDASVLGNWIQNVAGPVITTLSIFIVLPLMGFLAACLVFGGILAVYTPLIPYIIFTFGAIGWFILVVEAMIAAPLVAIGILSPSAEHEVLGKGHHALMLIFGVFLRPGLMVFGLMAAMLLAAVVVTLINVTFYNAMFQITGKNPDILEFIIFLGAYVYIIIGALNKCFSLIYHIPDRVLRWIGGHVEESGVAQALGEVKGGVEAAAGGAMGAGKGFAGGIEEGAGKGRTAHDRHKPTEQQKQQDKDAETKHKGT